MFQRDREALEQFKAPSTPQYALVSGLGDEKQVSTDAMRLGAAAMEKMGCAYRRQERLDDAQTRSQ